jgi:hypothetical protein
MPQFLRVEVQRDENAGEVRLIPNEEIRNRYVEENERLNRDDNRWNEDIVRDNLIIWLAWQTKQMKLQLQT